MDNTQRLQDLAVSDSGFVFDPYTGATFTLNASGLAILRGLQQRLDRKQLSELLHQRFEITNEDLHRDVDEFVQLLRRNELISKDFAL